MDADERRGLASTRDNPNVKVLVDRRKFLRWLKNEISERGVGSHDANLTKESRPISRVDVESLRELLAVVRYGNAGVRGRTVAGSFSLVDFEEYVHRNQVAEELASCGVRNRVFYIKLADWEVDLGSPTPLQDGLIRWPSKDAVSEEAMTLSIGHYVGEKVVDREPLLRYRIFAKRLLSAIEKNTRHSHWKQDKSSRDIHLLCGHGLHSFTLSVHLKDGSVFVKSIVLPLILVSEDSIFNAIYAPGGLATDSSHRFDQLGRIEKLLHGRSSGELRTLGNNSRSHSYVSVAGTASDVEEDRSCLDSGTSEGSPQPKKEVSSGNGAESENTSACSSYTNVSLPCSGKQEVQVLGNTSAGASPNNLDCACPTLTAVKGTDKETSEYDASSGWQSAADLESAAVAAEMAVNSARSAMLYAGNAMAILQKALHQARRPIELPTNMFQNPYAKAALRIASAQVTGSDEASDSEDCLPSKLADIQHYISQIVGRVGKSLLGHCRLTDFDEFLWQIQPIVRYDPEQPFLLQNLWDWFAVPGEYGLKVELRPTCESVSEAFFVPYLSAVCLYRDSGEEEGEIYPAVEFFEEKPPHSRCTFTECVELIANDDGAHLDWQHVKQQGNSIVDLQWDQVHPSSWFAVAWYPLYRIPDAPLQASFLAFYGMKGQPLGGEGERMAFPLFALEQYNTYKEQWFSPHNGDPNVRADALHRCEVLSRNAAMLHCMRSHQSTHPDYRFFVSRR